MQLGGRNDGNVLNVYKGKRFTRNTNRFQNRSPFAVHRKP